jgi:methylated-DNA-[protein]-cysteine S-methyltransferase
MIPTLEAPTVTRSVFYRTHPSPLGDLLLTSDGQALTGLHMDASRHPPPVDGDWVSAEEPFEEIRRQLDEYFAGRRTRFDLELAPLGTAFQRRVWSALQEIPYGETRSYLDIARSIGSPKAVRAVGGANGRNPIAVVIPCHRVIAADGSLGGYGGGLDRKRLLLDLEQRAG